MTDYKEYAKQMRENAVKNEQGNIVCTPELWEELASIVERAIIPPCKVGDMVYIPWTWEGQQGVGFAEIEEIKIYDNKNHIMFFIDLESDDEEFEQQYGGWKLDKSIGDTVFLTKEEAEAELRKRGKENA